MLDKDLASEDFPDNEEADNGDKGGEANVFNEDLLLPTGRRQLRLSSLDLRRQWELWFGVSLAVSNFMLSPRLLPPFLLLLWPR